MPLPSKSLENPHNPPILIHIMSVKTVITLILGLVFQLAQVLPGAAVTESCAPVGTSCACCESSDTCPCAKNGESEQQPSPLSTNSGSFFKLPAAKACDTRVSIESLRKAHPSGNLAPSPVAGPSNGYTGVRLSVAFCSFVI
jgi:hypothetical protein